jgi:hypothetical protein
MRNSRFCREILMVAVSGLCFVVVVPRSVRAQTQPDRSCRQTCLGPAATPTPLATPSPTPTVPTVCIPVNCQFGPCPCVWVTVTPSATPQGPIATPTATATPTPTVVPGSGNDFPGDWYNLNNSCGSGFECEADDAINDAGRCLRSRIGAEKPGHCVPASRALGIVDSRLVPDLPREVGAPVTCTLVCIGREDRSGGYQWDFDKTSPSVCSYNGRLAAAKTCATRGDRGKTQVGRLIFASPYQHGAWRERPIPPPTSTYRPKRCVKAAGRCLLQTLPAASCVVGRSLSVVTGCRKVTSSTATSYSCAATTAPFTCR